MQNYRRFFKAPILLKPENDWMVISKCAPSTPPQHPEAPMHEAVRKQISSRGGGDEEASLIHEVSTIIRSLLPTGNYSVERVAKCYACDKRTLQRYLREEADTTYQALLDDVRFELVQRYLRDSNMPITQLGYVVGFTDPSNFARAFRKRFGTPPKQWREQNTQSHSSSRRRRLSLPANLG
jgi:AraC-like DNA-binding protein